MRTIFTIERRYCVSVDERRWCFCFCGTVTGIGKNNQRWFSSAEEVVALLKSLGVGFHEYKIK
jgi:hypothetical protein